MLLTVTVPVPLFEMVRVAVAVAPTNTLAKVKLPLKERTRVGGGVGALGDPHAPTHAAIKAVATTETHREPPVRTLDSVFTRSIVR